VQIASISISPGIADGIGRSAAKLVRAGKITSHPFKWADLWCLCLQTQRGSLLIFCGPKTGGPRRAVRSSHLPLTEGPPLEKTPPADRPGGKVSAAPPGAPPAHDPRAFPDHPTWWLVPPGGRAHHGQGGEKNSPVRPLGAPTKIKILTRKSPPGQSALRPTKEDLCLRPPDCGSPALPQVEHLYSDCRLAVFDQISIRHLVRPRFATLARSASRPGPISPN
jgi:hypothetical protein